MFSLFAKNDSTPSSATATTDVPRRIIHPRTDIHDEAEAIVLTIEVPGCDDKGVHITTEDGVLQIRATPPSDIPKGYEPIWREREERVFERRFALPETVDSGTAQATVSDGVLTLRLPKVQQAKPRRITVQSA